MTTPVYIGSILYQRQESLDLFVGNISAVSISTTIMYHQAEVDGYLMKQCDGNMILNSERLFAEKTPSYWYRDFHYKPETVVKKS